MSDHSGADIRSALQHVQTWQAVEQIYSYYIEIVDELISVKNRLAVLENGNGND